MRELTEVAVEDRSEAWAESVRAVIQNASDADQDVQRIFDNAPESWQYWSMQIRPPSPSVSSSTSNSIPQYSDLQSSRPPSVSPSPNATESTESIENDGEQGSIPSYPMRIDVYPSPVVATLWNTFRCVRLHLLITLQELFLFLQKSPISRLPILSSPGAVRATLFATVNDICASVPFLPGDIDATGTLRLFSTAAGDRENFYNSIILLWCLHKVCRVPDLNAGLKVWVVTVLERNGTKREIRQALNLSRMHSITS